MSDPELQRLLADANDQDTTNAESPKENANAKISEVFSMFKTYLEEKIDEKGTVAHKYHNTIQIRKHISMSTTHFQTRNTTQWLPKTHFNMHNKCISKLGNNIRNKTQNQTKFDPANIRDIAHAQNQIC